MWIVWNSIHLSLISSSLCLIEKCSLILQRGVGFGNLVTIWAELQQMLFIQQNTIIIFLFINCSGKVFSQQNTLSGYFSPDTKGSCQKIHLQFHRQLQPRLIVFNLFWFQCSLWIGFIGNAFKVELCCVDI